MNYPPFRKVDKPGKRWIPCRCGAYEFPHRYDLGTCPKRAEPARHPFIAVRLTGFNERGEYTFEPVLKHDSCGALLYNLQLYVSMYQDWGSVFGVRCNDKWILLPE